MYSLALIIVSLINIIKTDRYVALSVGAICASTETAFGREVRPVRRGDVLLVYLRIIVQTLYSIYKQTHRRRRVGF